MLINGFKCAKSAFDVEKEATCKLYIFLIIFSKKRKDYKHF